MLDIGHRLFSKNAFLSVSKLHLHSVSINKHRQGTEKPEQLETHTQTECFNHHGTAYLYTQIHTMTSFQAEHLKNKHESCDWVAQKRKS